MTALDAWLNWNGEHETNCPFNSDRACTCGIESAREAARAEVARLRDGIIELRDGIITVGRARIDIIAERDALRAERDALRAALAEIRTLTNHHRAWRIIDTHIGGPCALTPAAARMPE